MSITLSLADGRRIDVSTEDGCIALLEFRPDIVTFLLENLEQSVLEVRETRLNALSCVGYYLPTTLRPGIDEKRKMTLLCQIWCQRELDGTFRRTGVLAQDVQALLNALVDWSREDDDVVSLMIEGGSKVGPLGSYARLCASCPKPKPEFVKTMMNVCTNCCESKVSKEMEATGMLTEVFRTAAMYANVEGDVGGAVLRAITALSMDGAFVRKRVKENTPTGDALAACVLACVNEEGNDTPVIGALKRLVLQADYSQKKREDGGLAQISDMCRNCSTIAKPGQRLLQCTRCKTAHYCNKLCQKTDWKRHKSECHPPEAFSSSGYGRDIDAKSNRNSAQNYVQNHIRLIRHDMRVVAANARRRGVSLSPHDLVIVLDFLSTSALEDLFTVTPAVDLYNRKKLPAFCRDESGAIIENNVASLLDAIKATQKRLEPNMVLVLVRTLTGGVDINRTTLKAPDGTELFSAEYLNMSEEEARVEDARLERVSNLWAQGKK
jgi:hypothetical protein